MGLKSPTPGLRVVHNSNTAQKVEITVPAGAELTVPVEVAAQMNDASTHFEVDGLAEAKAAHDQARAEEAKAAADARFRDDHRIPDEPAPATAAETVEDAKPRKRVAKKTS